MTAAQVAIPTSQTLYDSKKQYSIEEYLAMEALAPYKSEYHNGYIYPMPGGTYHHNLIASNIIRTLGNLVQALPKTYRVLNSDMKIHIPEDGSFV